MHSYHLLAFILTEQKISLNKENFQTLHSLLKAPASMTDEGSVPCHFHGKPISS